MSLRQRLSACLLLIACLWAQSSQALVVLMYHHVSEATPAVTSVTPARFAQHMRWLQDNQYDVMAMPELLNLLREDKPLPDKTVVITFDDGYASIYENAWPILKKLGWPFTVFINPQPHDENNRQYMSWPQLQTLAKAGVVFGNHSVSHPHMVRQLVDETSGQWRRRMEREIDDAQTRIDAQLGRQPKVFAYPFGEYNSELQTLLRTRDYIAFGQHSGPIASFNDRQALPRFAFGGIYGDERDFATKVSSLPMPLSQVVLRDEEQRELTDPLVPLHVDQPRLWLYGEAAFLRRVQCFFAGAVLELERAEGAVAAPSGTPLRAGRSRYNCTAPAGEGRFYWYSFQIMRQHADGSWYRE